MLITSTCGAAVVSTLGFVAPRGYRDRHSGWRGADPIVPSWHTSALVQDRFIEQPFTAHRAVERNPLVPRPRARRS